LDVSSSGFLLSVSIAKQNIRLWSITTGTPVLTSNFASSSTISCAKMLFNSSTLVVGLASNATLNCIQFFNLTQNQNGLLTLAAQVSLPDPSSPILDMSLTGEKYLVVCQQSGSVAFLNVATSTFVLALTPVGTSVVIPSYIELRKPSCLI
jgi:WD40 repeat protein